MFKIVSKTEVSPLKENLLRVFAVIIALFCSAIIMRIMGYNPFEVFKQIIIGSLDPDYRPKNAENTNSFLNAISSLRTNGRFQRTVAKAIPLLVLSLGIAIAFKMKFWNIGGEGQFYLGAFGASIVAFSAGNLPAYILIPLMFIVAFVFGGLWAMIPAILKSKFATSETLVTLMLNYIAIQWIDYLQSGPWKDPSAKGAAKIANYPSNAVLPQVFGIHIGWIIALVLVILVYIILNYTKLGYEIGVLGESETTAKYAGMSVTKITIISIMLSGGLCGLAGVIQASSSSSIALSSSLSGGLGFTAVITTWLAKLSPPVIIITSFMFAMLIQGGSTLQIALKMSPSVASILQGIIIFFVLGSEFFIRYKIVYKKKAIKEVA